MAVSYRIRGNRFEVDFNFRGERIRASIPHLNANNKHHLKLVEEFVYNMTSDLLRGKFSFTEYFPNHPKASKYQRASDIKMSKLFNDWLNRKFKEVAASTFKGYKNAIDYHLMPEFGHLLLIDIHSSLIRDWGESLESSTKTINNIMIPLREVLKRAFQDELIDRDPCSNVKFKVRQSPKVDPFNQEEVSKILDACTGQLHNVLKFAFWTGLRTSEYIALRWDDINLENNTAYIHQVRTSEGEKSTTKTASGTRHIRLLPPALEAIKDQQKYFTKGHVFRRDVDNLAWESNHSIRNIWVRLFKTIDVKYRKPYATRHTYASTLLSLGVNPMYVAQQMGHSDWGEIRKRYGKFIQDYDTSIDNVIASLSSQSRHKGGLND